MRITILHTSHISKPARVVQWLNHLGAMCRRAWRVKWPRSGTKKELSKIIPMHMMIREIIPGRQQRVRRCYLQNVTIAGILISSVKVLAALTSAEADRNGWDHWLTLNNRHQSIEPKPDSRPRLEGVHYKYLTSCSRLLSPSSPFSHAHTRTHH